MINTQGFPVENPALYIYRVHSDEPLDVTGRIIKYGDVPWVRRRGAVLGRWHYQADPEPADVPVKAVAGILTPCTESRSRRRACPASGLIGDGVGFWRLLPERGPAQ